MTVSGPTGYAVLKDPHLHVVLFQPEIPANTGNIARLCGAARMRLHLIHPLGFSVDDKHLKRAGLDYWPEIDVWHHPDFNTFLKERDKRRQLLCFSRHAEAVYTGAKVNHGDYVLFGRETLGLPLKVRETYPCYRIPIWGKVRSLNLSTTVGIVTYHYLHEIGLF